MFGAITAARANIEAHEYALKEQRRMERIVQSNYETAKAAQYARRWFSRIGSRPSPPYTHPPRQFPVPPKPPKGLC